MNLSTLGRDRNHRAPPKSRGSRARRRASFYACGQCARLILSIFDVTLAPFRISYSLPQSSREEITRLDAMRRVVRTCIDATGFRLLGAEIAGGRLFLHDRLFVPRMFMIVGLRGERVQIDISVRAIFGAQSAAYAPILDDDLERISPADRADRAAHHAQWIPALAA